MAVAAAGGGLQRSAQAACDGGQPPGLALALEVDTRWEDVGGGEVRDGVAAVAAGDARHGGVFPRDTHGAPRARGAMRQGEGARRALLLVLAIAGVLWFVTQWRKAGELAGGGIDDEVGYDELVDEEFFAVAESGPRQFQYSDLTAATKNFYDERREERNTRVLSPLSLVFLSSQKI
uniref:Uncharacterized protein n=1 Tax=Oryza brachyantha TaxID=4533 RepID=J3N1U6_ORYBR